MLALISLHYPFGVGDSNARQMQSCRDKEWYRKESEFSLKEIDTAIVGKS